MVIKVARSFTSSAVLFCCSFYLCVSAVYVFPGVAVTSAYMHSMFYARIAVKPYDSNQLDDSLVAITVCGYDEDEELAAQQIRMNKQELQCQLEQDYPALNWDKMVDEMRGVLSELFGSVGPSIGHWPQCSAYYGVDVIFDASEEQQTHRVVKQQEEFEIAERVFVPQPKLLEVNFMADWAGVEKICEDRAEFQQWMRDVVAVTGTRESLSENPRLVPL